MHPQRSPKSGGQAVTMGKKKKSPKISKRKSPKATKQRAQWNLALEKSLVDILHEYNDTYYRGQNGWSKETWNEMANKFLERNMHVNFDKQQIQDKEKELKRDYRLIKDARSQSGVGWDEKSFKLPAEPHLWDNLEISFGKRIMRFQQKHFPLYDTLGELYHKHTAEGSYNFTATAEHSLNPNVTDVESDDDNETEINQPVVQDEEVQVLDQVQMGQVNPRARNVGPSTSNSVAPSTSNNAAPSTRKNKRPKNSPKRSSGDAMVGVMDRFVKIKEQEANQEAKQDFSIAKCIAALRTLEGFVPADKPKAFNVFKSEANRQIFLSSLEDNDGSAIDWLRLEMGN